MRGRAFQAESMLCKGSELGKTRVQKSRLGIRLRDQRESLQGNRSAEGWKAKNMLGFLFFFWYISVESSLDTKPFYGSGTELVSAAAQQQGTSHYVA